MLVFHTQLLLHSINIAISMSSGIFFSFPTLHYISIWVFTSFDYIQQSWLLKHNEYAMENTWTTALVFEFRE